MQLDCLSALDAAFDLLIIGGALIMTIFEVDRHEWHPILLPMGIVGAGAAGPWLPMRWNRPKPDGRRAVTRVADRVRRSFYVGGGRAEQSHG